MSQKTVFVTGANGFIGFELCKALKEKHPTFTVVALVRNEQQAKRARGIGAEPLVGDLLHIHSFQEALAKAHYVYHLGANATFGKGASYEEVNVGATAQIVEVLKSSKQLERLVFTSTVGVLDREPSDSCIKKLTKESSPAPSSDYGLSKLRCEEIIETSSLPYTIVRPTWVYGPGMRLNSHIAVFFQKCATNAPLTRLSLPGRVSVIYITDLTDALCALVGHTSSLGKKLLAADGSPVSFGEIFDLGRRLSHHASSVLHSPLGILARMCSRVARFVPFQAKCILFDALVAEPELFSTLNMKPRVSFVEGGNATFADVQNRVRGIVAITGAASGIGEALARQMTKAEQPLLLIDRSESLEGIAKSLGQNLLKTDLLSTSGLDEVATCLADSNLPLKGLINCAGIGFRGDLQNQTEKQIEDTVRLNLVVPMMLCRRVLPLLRSTGKGFIVNVASSISTVPLPGMAPYGASKAGLLSFGRSLWGEVQGTGVRVLTVLPSGTRTRFQSSAGVKVLKDGKGLLEPEHVARKIIAAIPKEHPTIRIGAMSRIVQSLLGLLPERAEIVVWRRLFASTR